VGLHCVTSRKKFFTSYISGDFGALKMSNDCVSKVVGGGQKISKLFYTKALLLRTI